MPFDPATGLFTRTANSFSDPVFGTEIDPTDATSLFNDYDDAFGLGIHVVTAAGAITVAANDVHLLINKTAGSATPITLPTSLTRTKPLMIVDLKGDAAANNITVSFTGGQLCEGQATIVLNNNYASLWFYPITSGSGGWYLDGSTTNAQPWTIRGNATATTGLPTNFRIDTDLANKATPAAGDFLVLQEASGGALKNCLVSSVASAGSVSSIAGNTGAFTLTAPITNATNAIILNATITAQGRPSLVTATPVMTTSQAGATTVYYTPYVGNLVPLYDGTNMIPAAFAEVSQATTDSTKSPAAVAASKNYDLFAWLDGATFRVTRGPTWDAGAVAGSDVARGTGANSTELVRVKGIYLNANDIVNGPAAQRGTYVGTIRSNASSTIDYIFGALAANGTAGVFNVWSAYNRVPVGTMVRDNTNTWGYNVATTWRAANGSATMNVSMVRGLDEDRVTAIYSGIVVAGAATFAVAGIGVDSTTAPSGMTAPSNSSSNNIVVPAHYSGIPGLGLHTVWGIEFNSTTTSSTWSGDANVTYIQSGLMVELFT